MAKTFGAFAVLSCRIGGQPFNLIKSISLDTDSGNVEVDSLALGLAGVSQGVPKITGKITTSRSKQGQEELANGALDQTFGTAAGPLPINFVVKAGLQSKVFNGFIMKMHDSQSTNQAATIEYDILGEYSPWTPKSTYTG